jgi:tRNA pseudouridine65 synthase
VNIPILYEDECLVVVNKPPGILVHRTRLSEDTVFLLQMLRDQLGGTHLFPAHRLDRATSGVLIFAKHTEAASWLGERLMEYTWEKKYLAVVRGYLPDDTWTIDYPLADPETGKAHQPAVTHGRRLGQSELPWAIGLRYPTARFSLLEIEPETGRRQQIRKHLSHLRHPIINDTRHGDVKITTWFRQQNLPMRLLLHAWRLRFPHPTLSEPLEVVAPLDPEFWHLLDTLQLSAYVPDALQDFSF